ncbi:hypothetical protein PT282_03850 [Bifidobacterium sp. ESL0763]|uniref:hypothetical protein n=1 Tax=Bifidobacterium sp. ESL0763 TaxID=2983227 RepID=UPI0023FA1B3E|nr:hypothetical protein [Bifidobacterium sp. ESL0763]MDF7663800.1 hypothetical protein [Bifidobacterium sp. ESL0763]
MTWWDWLILVLLMLAVLAAGVAYAGVHAYHAAKGISSTMGGLSHYLDAMRRRNDASDREPSVPSFTEPLERVSHRYSEAHEGVVARGMRKRAGHGHQWARWRDNPIPDNIDEVFAGNQASDAETAKPTQSGQATIIAGATNR